MIGHFNKNYGWRSPSLPLVLGAGMKKRAPAVILNANYNFTVSGFIALPLALFFLSYFFSRTALSVSFTFLPVGLLPHRSFPSPLSPLTCLSHLLRALLLVPRPEHGQSHANFAIITGPPGCRHRSSWEIYFACQQ